MNLFTARHFSGALRSLSSLSQFRQWLHTTLASTDGYTAIIVSFFMFQFLSAFVMSGGCLK